jgi:hypothetical protein
MSSTTIVEIVDEPYLSRAREYRAQFTAAVAAWQALKNEFGASGIPGSLRGLNFSRGKQPAGWTVPKANGFSRPKNGHPDAARIAAMPRDPDKWAVFAGADIPDSLSYTTEHGSGSGAISSDWSGPPIGWVQERYFARIPDVRAAAEDHLKRCPSDTVPPEALAWDVPAGLVRISKAEYDLIVAQDAVDRERSKAA